MRPESANASTRRWKADDTIEAHLNREGVRWEYLENVQVAQIDGKASLTNQARIRERIRQDVVEAYALAMMDGDVFPALVAHQRRDGAYVLMGGNHRLAAAKLAEITTVDLYLVASTDEAIIRLVTTTLNNVEGWRPPADEILEQAVRWMEEFGRSVKAAAVEYRVSPHVLATELRARQAKRRLRAVDVSDDRFTRSSLARLNSIENDNVLKAVADLGRQAALSGEQIDKVVVDVRSQRTEAAQLAAVQQWRDREDIRRRESEAARGIVAHRGPDARVRLLQSLTWFERILEKNPTLASLGITAEEDCARTQERIRRVIVGLEGWLGA